MKHFIKKLLLTSICISSVGLSSAIAQSFLVQPSVIIGATCKVSATNVSFGTITPVASGEATATGTISSLCSFGTFYTIRLDDGVAGTFADRKMSGTSTNTDKLSYQLYKNNTYTQIFGDGTGSTTTITALGLGLTNTNTIYGRLALNQYIKPDNYSDTLVVSVTY